MNDITVMENRPLSASDIKANVNLIQQVLKAVMKVNVHYGTIPGTQKPTLYKAGSEKILSTFRIAVELDVEDLSSYDCFRYRVKARGVIPSGEVIGCGIGECSTDEEKYKWRGVVNDREWEATPEDRKRIKYTRNSDIRQVRTNPADLANTALKMAKKRAQIDLTLTATAASDVFEQDLEDLPEEYVDGMRQEQKGKPEVSQPQSKSQKAEELNEAQLKYFPRIAEVLDVLYDDQAAKDEKIVELTTWTKNKGKENEEVVPGNANYRLIKTEKTLEILCHRLEALAKKAVKEEALPEVCNECRQNPCVCEKANLGAGNE